MGEVVPVVVSATIFPGPGWAWNSFSVERKTWKQCCSPQKCRHRRCSLHQDLVLFHLGVHAWKTSQSRRFLQHRVCVHTFQEEHCVHLWRLLMIAVLRHQLTWGPVADSVGASHTSDSGLKQPQPSLLAARCACRLQVLFVTDCQSPLCFLWYQSHLAFTISIVWLSAITLPAATAGRIWCTHFWSGPNSPTLTEASAIPWNI